MTITSYSPLQKSHYHHIKYTSSELCCFWCVLAQILPTVAVYESFKLKSFCTSSQDFTTLFLRIITPTWEMAAETSCALCKFSQSPWSSFSRGGTIRSGRIILKYSILNKCAVLEEESVGENWEKIATIEMHVDVALICCIYSLESNWWKHKASCFINIQKISDQFPIVRNSSVNAQPLVLGGLSRETFGLLCLLLYA